MYVSIDVLNSGSDSTVGNMVFRGSLVAYSAAGVLFVSRKVVSTLS